MNTEGQTQFTRSHRGYIAGICTALGKRFNIDPLYFRIAWIAAVMLLGTGVLLYLLVWWITPDQTDLNDTRWEPMASNQLVRTRTDRKFLGVAGGLARHWDMDPTLIRLGLVAIAGLSCGLAVVAYLISAVLIQARPMRQINSWQSNIPI
jgi:phage shock protein C